MLSTLTFYRRWFCWCFSLLTRHCGIVWLFSSSTNVFCRFFFYWIFFPRYQFVQCFLLFTNYIIWFSFSHCQNYRIGIKIKIIYIYIYIYILNEKPYIVIKIFVFWMNELIIFNNPTGKKTINGWKGREANLFDFGPFSINEVTCITFSFNPLVLMLGRSTSTLLFQIIFLEKPRDYCLNWRAETFICDPCIFVIQSLWDFCWRLLFCF